MIFGFPFGLVTCISATLKGGNVAVVDVAAFGVISITGEAIETWGILAAFLTTVKYVLIFHCTTYLQYI